MITLVYVSDSPSYVFENKIRELSGVDEVQCICVTKSDLSRGYKEALNQSHNKVIVFLHKDVTICSQNWGKRVLDMFGSSSYGILGVLGTIIAPICGMLWEKEEPLCGTIWYEEYTKEGKNTFSEDGIAECLDVVAVEGSFIAVDKTRIKNTFDCVYRGDSFFDSDFCIENYKSGVKVGVMSGVDVLKRTFDVQDDNFQVNREIFEEKQKEKPVRIVPKLIVNKDKMNVISSPSVMIVIVNNSHTIELFSCLESIYEKTDYSNYIIKIIDTGSKKSEMHEMEKFIENHPNTEIIKTKQKHLPSIYNKIAQKYESDVLVFLSKNIVLHNDIISRMVATYEENKETCGTVGIRTHQKHHMVRQFGLQLSSIETEDGFELGVEFNGFGKAYGYKDQTVEGIMGNTLECFLIQRELFLDVGGFNTDYDYSLEDFELNLRLIVQGKKNYLAGKACGLYLGFDKPKYLPKDFVTLVNYINGHIDEISPYVCLVNPV